MSLCYTPTWRLRTRLLQLIICKLGKEASWNSQIFCCHVTSMSPHYKLWFFMLVCCALAQFLNNLIGWSAAHLNPSPADSQFHVRPIVMFTEAHTKAAEDIKICLSMLHIIVTTGELPPRKAIHWKIWVIQPLKRRWIHQPSLHQIHLILPENINMPILCNTCIIAQVTAPVWHISVHKVFIFRELWMTVMNYIYLKETQAACVQKCCLYYLTFIILQLAFKFATGAALGTVGCSAT